MNEKKTEDLIAKARAALPGLRDQITKARAELAALSKRLSAMQRAANAPSSDELERLAQEAGL